MANTDAKMIGAQLQSLLKIPPIKKAEPPPDPRKETGPQMQSSSASTTKGTGVLHHKYAGRSEEKENSSSTNKYKSADPVPANVPRDRFGRPFQSIDRDRERRGRGYQQPPPPRRFGNTHSYTRSVENQGSSEGRFQDDPRPNRGNKSSKPEAAAQPEPEPEEKEVVTPARDREPDFDVLIDDRGCKKLMCYIKYQSKPKFEGLTPEQERELQHLHPEVYELSKRPDFPKDLLRGLRHCHDTNLTYNTDLWDMLKFHSVFKNTSTRYGRVRFYCSCCNYHMDYIHQTLNHILQERHTFLKQMWLVTNTVSNFPNPSAEHISYMTDLVMKTSKMEGMNNTERTQRQEILQRLSEAIKANKLDCQAMLFGSTVSGLGFRDSNVNININVGSDPAALPVVENGLELTPNTPKTPTSVNPVEFSGVISKLVSIIKDLPHVAKHSVKEIYTPKCVSIQFYEERARAPCIIHFNNTSAVLASKLFTEYEKLDPRVRPLVLCFRHFARVCDMDDQEKGFLPAHCYALMVIHFLQLKDVLPILHLIPRLSDHRPFASAEQVKGHWKSSNTETVGDLFLQLLRFYAIIFNYRDRMISISRLDNKINRDEKQWNRKICIEDPIIPKSNLSRTITNNKICDYIVDRIKYAARYFWTPQTIEGPLFDGILNEGHFRTEFAVEYKLPVDLSHITDKQLLKKQFFVNFLYSKNNVYKYVTPSDADDIEKILTKNMMHYDFKFENFNNGVLPPMICKSCGNEGHFRSGCPEEIVPPYLPVAYPSPLTLSRLNTAININFAREAIDERDVSLRIKIVDEIKSILLPVFPTISLTLFGSTLNGFGMHSSDLDMCLTFSHIIVPPGGKGIYLIEVGDVLDKITNALKASGKVTDVLAIGSAKVPIVKFRHTACRMDGDISLYNRISIYNTELLRAYVDLDERVAPLGLFLKKLVKFCDIGDASKGSLSSYCYILMLIHFLQNHTKPVLPVLQEFPTLKLRPTTMHCDGHCIEFEDDLELVKKTWDGYGKNRETVSQLWLEFLNYYVEKFDNEKFVITISQITPLSRLEKGWHTEGLAIEDPFDKTHNLGGGLSRRMSVHILKTFQKCRLFFHESTDHLANDVRLLDYFFATKNIREGNPPIDRQCRLCNRIGHYARNCSFTNKGESEEHENENAQQRNIPESFPAPVKPAPITSVDKTVGGPTGSSELKKESTADDPDSLSDTDPAVVLYSKAPLTKLQNGASGFGSETTTTKPSVKRRITGAEAESNLLSLFKNHTFFAKPSPPPPAVSAPSEVKPEVKKDVESPQPQPVKEVVFFGDIGGANPEGERIQAMLQKNEGVTFTFDLGQRPTQAMTENQQEDIKAQETPQPNNNIIVGQPPPGFCPPNVYAPITSSIHPSLPYLQMPNNLVQLPPPSQPPMTIAYRHSQPVGVSLPFQPIIPIVTGAFENRPPAQLNGETNERIPPAGGVTAPPPGFAPLPGTVSNANIISAPTDLARTFSQPLSVGPNVGLNVYSGTPVNMNFQQHNGFVSAPSAPPQESEDSSRHPSLNYEANPLPVGPMVASSPMMMHSSVGNLPPAVPGFPARPDVIVNRGVNGHPEAGEDHMHPPQQPQHPPGPIMKPGIAAGEQGYSMEFGGGGMVPHGNHHPPSVSSYGLSLSQAHHAPVVSALQMQHSPHHPPPLPMQGGHFHHHVRPYMPPPLGNYAGNTYPYPQMPVPHAMPPPPHPGMQPHIQGNSTPIQSGDASSGSPWK